MLKVNVIYGKGPERRKQPVTLYGFHRLTPAAARAALEIVTGLSYGGEVWSEVPATDQGLDYSQVYGYRVYKNTTRKLWP